MNHALVQNPHLAIEGGYCHLGKGRTWNSSKEGRVTLWGKQSLVHFFVWQDWVFVWSTGSQPGSSLLSGGHLAIFKNVLVVRAEGQGYWYLGSWRQGCCLASCSAALTTKSCLTKMSTVPRLRKTNLEPKQIKQAEKGGETKYPVTGLWTELSV